MLSEGVGLMNRDSPFHCKTRVISMLSICKSDKERRFETDTCKCFRSEMRNLHFRPRASVLEVESHGSDGELLPINLQRDSRSVSSHDGGDRDGNVNDLGIKSGKRVPLKKYDIENVMAKDIKDTSGWMEYLKNQVKGIKQHVLANIGGLSERGCGIRELSYGRKT